jgi:MoaA/NifB/PqqE/SkfB family radical SAM enzyme
MIPIKFYGKGASNSEEFIVSWNLGNTCNWSCSYCPSYLHDGTVGWANIERIKPILLQIKNRLPNKKIRVEFVGGEVTLKNDFIDLMKFCREQDFNNCVVSNASRTVRYWEELAPYLDVAVLSFHPEFASREHYENIIRTCIDNNVNVNCQIAMMKDSFWDLAKYRDYLRETFPTVYTDFAVLYDKENKFNHKNGYFYDYDETHVQYLNDEGQKEFVIEYDNGEEYEYSINEVRSMNLNDFRGFMCGSELTSIAVDYRGGTSISVCAQRGPVNVYKHGIDSILEPRLCEQPECRNPADIRILKIRK